ncbi:MAG: phage terminase small subunit P27 family [Alphaproteobacteria bacterium]
MGKRGRPPKPIEQRKAEGNPGKRPLPTPVKANKAGEDFEAPENVRECNIALSVWHELIPQLQESELLTTLDRWQLAAYCRAVGRWVRADRNIRKLGAVVKGHKNRLSSSPWAREANAALEQMKAFGSEFGLSPVARTRLATEAPDPEDNSFSSLEDLRADLEGVDLGRADPRGEA